MKKYKDNIINILKGIAIIIWIMILVFLLSIKKSPIIETRDIKSCVLTSEVKEKANGAFILGIGGISSEKATDIHYYIYIKGNEGFRLQQIPSQNLEIVETNEVKPCIKGCFNTNGKIYEDKFDVTNDKYSSDFVEEMTNYIIYIPEGTIKEEYSINIDDIN